jgi:hypothetical protein
MFETLYWLLGYDAEDEDVEYSVEKDKIKRQKYLCCKQIQDGDIPRLRSVYLRHVKPLKRDKEVIMGIPVNKAKKTLFKRNKAKPFHFNNYTLGLGNELNHIL